MWLSIERCPSPEYRCNRLPSIPSASFFAWCGEGDAGAVGGPSRGPVIVARYIRQASAPRAIHVHGVDFPIILGREGDLLPIGRPCGFFVGTAESEKPLKDRRSEVALRGAVGVHDDESSFFVGGIDRVNDPLCVRRPAGPVAVGEPLPTRAVGVHHVDRFVAFEYVRDKSDLLTIRGPGG